MGYFSQVILYKKIKELEKILKVSQKLSFHTQYQTGKALYLTNNI